MSAKRKQKDIAPPIGDRLLTLREAAEASTRFKVEPSELPGFHQNGQPSLHLRERELFVAKGNDGVNAGSALRGNHTR